MISILKDISALLFPSLCLGCALPLSDNEAHICTRCRHQLPLTHIHIDNADTAEKIFYGRIKIEKATALLWFEKRGIVQHLIHQLKYKGHEEAGELLGEWLGTQLCEIPHYGTVDMVIPVPLHPKKQRERGYNQSAAFGMALARHLKADYRDDILVRKRHTKTQTRKTRLLRWESMRGIFAIRDPGAVSGKHVLLADDVITTGATLEACAAVLLETGHVRISIAVMAIAV
ncbi:MAG: ComF family protein [Sinomicrobium sp.]|nr:ComF family protein [Sinomicrobium sp.]